MKNKISDKERLLHILDSIDSIIDFTQNISYQQYIDDFKLRLALIKLLEIIGEAANGISEETQLRFSEVEWSILKSVRNVLVHEYYGIDYDIIWNTIKDRIPELKQKISTVLLQL
jgi:uncharacterized protein with HEPN domain